MDGGLLERIGREAGTAELVEILAERLAGADLTSLLLEVARRRAARVTPPGLLAAYERDRFAGASTVDTLAREVEWFTTLRGMGFDKLELSPVAPLGTVSALTALDQDRVITTVRRSEVLADSTNVLALEAALRRRDLMRADPRTGQRVLLCASHRLVRTQPDLTPGHRPHFKLMALVTAGRDEGSFGFELAALREHIRAHLTMIGPLPEVEVVLTDLSGGKRIDLLSRAFPQAGFDQSLLARGGYYRGACFSIYVTTPQGRRIQLADGGFTDWTARLLSNRKERLLTSGLGVELLAGLLGAGG
jgi:hypothetical protein